MSETVYLGEKNLSLVVSNWTRNFSEISHYIWVNDLSNVIIKYSLIPVQWDPNLKPKDILIENNTIKRIGKGNGWKTTFLNYNISNSVNLFHHWKFKIINVIQVLELGIVPLKQVKDTINSSMKGLSFYFYSKTVYTQINGKVTALPSDKWLKNALQFGDLIEIYLDFKNETFYSKIIAKNYEKIYDLFGINDSINKKDSIGKNQVYKFGVSSNRKDTQIQFIGYDNQILQL